MERRGFLGLAARLLTLCPGLGLKQALAGSEISKPTNDWDSVEFKFEVAERSYPGIAIKLPQSAGSKDGLFVACKVCPHQGCEFGYEKDYAAVGDIVGKDFANPVLFCRCHLSIYDPAQDGKVVNGPAPRPPWRFDYSIDGSHLLIRQIEEGVGTFGN